MIFRGKNTVITSRCAHYSIIKDIRETQQKFFLKSEGEKEIKSIDKFIEQHTTLSEQVLKKLKGKNNKNKKPKKKKELMNLL